MAEPAAVPGVDPSRAACLDGLRRRRGLSYEAMEAAAKLPSRSGRSRLESLPKSTVGEIVRGFQIGDKLPPIAELQKRYGCENNLNMIRHAQSVLIDEGLIAPRQGLGTYVIALPGSADNSMVLAEAAEELRAALEAA